jgi:hypothetical protein|tara:strand:- start:983 stop:1180 length:198 start_codon:yes stop_codon:yes gene_type:complete
MDEYDDLKREARQEIEGVKSSLSQGVCETYAEYQHMVGLIHGMEKVVTMCSDIERRLIQDDKDDF